MKKIIIIALSALLVLSTITFSGLKVKADSLEVLFLYCDDETHTYLDQYQHFQQSLVIDVEVEAKSCEQINSHDLKDYDAIYFHRSLLQGQLIQSETTSIEKFVEDGGIIFVENDLHALFSKELIGASSFQKLAQYPFEIASPEVNDNVRGVQQVVQLFVENIAQYYQPEDFAKMNLGVSMTTSSATSIIDMNGQSLYALNQFGEGKVLFLSNIITNDYFIEGFDMKPKGQEQESFNFMFATGSYLLKNELLSLLAKEKIGYSVSKILGTNGRPTMAWQNHFEALEAIKEGSMEKWIDLLKEHNQIPSYSLVRESYDWGTWKEGIVFHQNIGSTEAPAYQGENEASQYSSGEIIQIQGEPLALQQYPSEPSLFTKIDLPYRAAIDAGDLNQDGQVEIVAGSANGEVVLIAGQGDSKRNFNEQIPLLLTNGEPVKVNGYAAPTLFDYNHDGLDDLIIGSEDGKIYYFEQTQDFTFRASKILMNTPHQFIVPAIGNIDEDEVEDLIIGNAEGNLLYYKGQKNNSSHAFSTNGILLRDVNGPINVGEFSAPTIVDYDGNGKQDVLVGMNEGFIARYEWNDENFINKGYVEGSTYNQFGDHRLWGGRNSIPTVTDFDGDGTNDLLVGHLIFGYAMPIDAESFPYKKELKASLKYAAEHFIDIQPHIFFHNYKSVEQEQAEIDLHKQTFDIYGLPWNYVGTNQHTWRINNSDSTQSFNSQLKNGVWWNSGFRPANEKDEPSLSKHYLWTMPFLLADGEQTKNFVVFNPAPNVPLYEKAYPSYGELDLPITHFYHIEYPILTEDGTQSLLYKVELLNKMREQYDYNFVMEEQMNKGFLAAYKTEAELSRNMFTSLYYAIKNQFFTKQQHRFVIKNRGIADEQVEEIIGDYKDALGYKVEMGDKYRGYVPHTNASIYSHNGTTLYVSDVDDIQIYFETEVPNEPHIVRANLPVEIEQNNENWHIQWNDAGLQQMKVYAPNGLELSDSEWELEQDGDYYVLTRYGDVTELTFTVK